MPGSSSSKKALVTGVTGQDGAFLASFLLKKGYKVYGTYRRLSTPNFWRLQVLGIYHKIGLMSFDLADMSSILEAMSIVRPTEIYNLAAQSFVGSSFDQPLSTANVTGLGVARVLEAYRNLVSAGILSKQHTRFYQASTSELYGPGNMARTEDTPFLPASPYAAAKLYAHWMTRMYREAYGLKCSAGILFNHESPLRGLEFVTRRVSNGAAKISLGLSKDLKLGNMDAERDWGYAPEYVEAMWMMLQEEEPEDYVIATGDHHSVKELAKEAFGLLDMDYKDYVKVDRGLIRPLDIPLLYGDPSKARKKFGWKPSTGFKELVKVMVDTDRRNWGRWKKGEKFPWDAPNYPSEARILTRHPKL